MIKISCQKSNTKGFTLIELIVVIAVLSVLAAIVIPAMTNNLSRAHESVDMSYVRELNLATQLYYHGERVMCY